MPHTTDVQRQFALRLARHQHVGRDQRRHLLPLRCRDRRRHQLVLHQHTAHDFTQLRAPRLLIKRALHLHRQRQTKQKRAEKLPVLLTQRRDENLAHLLDFMPFPIREIQPQITDLLFAQHILQFPILQPWQLVPFAPHLAILVRHSRGPHQTHPARRALLLH